MSIHRLFVVCAAATAVAAGGRPSGADEPSKAETTCFVGESKMKLPNGRVIRTSVSLVKRVVDRSHSRIEEHVLTVDERDSKPFVVTFAVDGSTFTMTEKSGSFTGAGELGGEAWKWTTWKSVSKLAGGVGTVTSEDKLTDGRLSAKKTFTGADGKVSVLFEESLDPISAKTYELLYARLAPAAKK